MSGQKRTDVPETITPEAWADIQRRAQEANPSLTDITGKEGVERRKLVNLQYKNRALS